MCRVCEQDGGCRITLKYVYSIVFDMVCQSIDDLIIYYYYSRDGIIFDCTEHSARIRILISFPWRMQIDCLFGEVFLRTRLDEKRNLCAGVSCVRLR